MMTRCVLAGICGLVGCVSPKTTPPASGVSAQATPLRVISTADWGCVAPPFRRERCGREPDEAERPRACFVLSRTSHGSWDPASFGGAVYVLQGHETGETMTLPDWFRARDLPVPEGICDETRYPVFEFDTWCTEASPSDFRARYEDPAADSDYAAWVTQTADEIHAHRCVGD